MSRGGEEYPLAHADYTAVVTQVGAGLRTLRHGERDLVLGYAQDEVRPRYRGALLAPWPNRVVDGHYHFDGEDHQLPLTEPERHHALHGLVCWERFRLVEAEASSVVLSHRLVPRTGYPFDLEVEVRYTLGEDGLTYRVTTRNMGSRRAPYGTSGHPYVVTGADRVDGYRLELPADRVLRVTSRRLVPLDVASVHDAGLDFRSGLLIEGAEIDHAFTGLSPGDDGHVHVRVTDHDGRGVECSWDPQVLPWVQVHTADLPDPAASRRALALEPMTCPPDAFNSGTDLVVLEPGESHVAEWTYAAL